jgi:hypothetical protein
LALDSCHIVEHIAFSAASPSRGLRLTDTRTVLIQEMQRQTILHSAPLHAQPDESPRTPPAILAQFPPRASAISRPPRRPHPKARLASVASPPAQSRANLTPIPSQLLPRSLTILHSPPLAPPDARLASLASPVAHSGTNLTPITSQLLPRSSTILHSPPIAHHLTPARQKSFALALSKSPRQCAPRALGAPCALSFWGLS